MKIACSRCGYALRSYLRSEGAFRFIVYFDDGKEVERCPGCTVRLNTGIKPERAFRETEGFGDEISAG